MERESPVYPQSELRSVRQELHQQAEQLGLPKHETVMPESELSPHHGDPTTVDDRPFAASQFYAELAAEWDLDWGHLS
ncbi:MAG: hypothetical protein HC910_10040 [Spirulinaceae cyanobacterium SM2_1_0]|nr:hypothetical protein [Spirulinaceae cyanobacterium SM2_1_0]